MRILLLTATGLVAAAPAAAEVTSSSPIHFDIESRVTVAATPDRAWEALGRIGAWWDGEHSYSGDAANMRLELRAGGCFCETLPDGGTVEHMHVVQALPGRVLRMTGALGPLQSEALTGTLTWTLRAVPDGTEISSVYLVSGHVRGDVSSYAAPVDTVLRAQLERLRAHLAH
ncbi:MAG TPA: SRPBCC domain-containing protein [Allosphingosinicella sp.]|nr:SRPBCC domain-containing protein [Allosphingosinicella sp.]